MRGGIPPSTENFHRELVFPDFPLYFHVENYFPIPGKFSLPRFRNSIIRTVWFRMIKWFFFRPPSMKPIEKNQTIPGENRHKQLDRALTRQQGRRGALIEVLHEAQRIFGYLPRDVLAYIAQALHLPPSHVFGVASFYPSFQFTPPARHSVTVCMGTACYVNGSFVLLKAAEAACGCHTEEISSDQLFSVHAAHCLGSCGSGPVIRTEEGTQHCANVEQVHAIIAALREDAG